MSGLLNVGARALMANQVALQTAGHNISNVNVAGYSRQKVVLDPVQGQFTGGGYIGKGVSVTTVLREHDELLTRQAAAAQSMQASDAVRAQRLMQLQNIFSGGTQGLGAAINDMLNSLGDVVTSPTDITARTVSLTRMDEVAARMRSSAQQLQELGYAVDQQLASDMDHVNTLARNVAAVNEQIASARGNGQTPNDLLDQRDQLIRELNQYVQTTQIPADDGTMGIFVGGSQALVLGNKAATLAVRESQLFPGSAQRALYFTPPGGMPIEMSTDLLGGGEVTGLMRFANTDLSDAGNLLGRMALAIGATLNRQQALGLTLDGAQGQPLFSVPASMPGYSSNMATQGQVSFSDPAAFAASDYEVRFTSAAPPGGVVVRLSDGKSTTVPDFNAVPPPEIDGLRFQFTTPGVVGERVLFKPFFSAASSVQALVKSPRDLAAANPVNARMGTSNTGTLQLAGLQASGPALTLPPNGDPATPPTFAGGIELRFTGPGSYDIVNQGSAPPITVATGQSYVPGQPITIDGWTITLQGTPHAGDTVSVGNALDPQYGDWYTRDAGNAKALMNLRDARLFDESSMADGYASLMAQVGTRTQSALYAAKVSASIADDLEASRTAVSGVNLDEEAAKLIQYQQAYQASAKVLQVAQNIFDNLISIVGR
ncbi:flagellar hook-associated protein FlgK [Comamonas sp. NLF-1-9]|uniref:flagellar hook-associated protein FlgK n=1 Tax=Comamonas sp. NLF-1-9 TaxID=2853163 RepID=UPI001C463B1E|nr:flagellar hook-associated protein FlgK [Comamonas sp. NLF-1-9]QXL84247.1 flagellar hook-associated protein FlgK [Comamonas sp. NLF-1-9]